MAVIDEIKNRLKASKNEILLYKNYDYIIINDDFNEAFKELESIYIAEHCKTLDIKKIEDIVDLEV